MRILLAEDESMMADAVRAYLGYHGYTVDWAPDGTAALDMARSSSYDCLILDVMMPGMDGVSVLSRLRKEDCAAPAIFLTAKGELEDKTKGFRAGGDDYLTKPFSMEELLLRVEALSKRGRAILSDRMTFADVVLDRDACAMRVGGRSEELSPRELQLMSFLIRNPHVYHSADTLLDRVWGMDAFVEQGTVWAHVSYLRKKLAALGAHASIVSKRNVGYALEETE